MNNKSVGVAYWVCALVLAALAAIAGGTWAIDQAPTFRDVDKGAPATSMSHILYGVVGGLVGFGLVAAVAAGIWLLLWARRRRATYVDDYDDYDHDVDLLDRAETDDLETDD